MTEVLVPTINSYFAIYTVEGPSRGQESLLRGLNWDLHATATDRSMAISHARMLALQPGVHEVHVKQVTENLVNGQVCVRDVKRCKRGSFDLMRIAGFAACASLLAVACAVFL